jgi:mannosyltransferase OCH1-like enzyme
MSSIDESSTRLTQGYAHSTLNLSTGDAPTSSAIAEDGLLRSHYMRHLIHDADAYLQQRTASVLPRVLVQFWDDSKAIPADVRECIDSWRPLEADGFRRFLFDDYSAAQFIADHFGRRYLAAFERCQHPAMRSDYFRLCFILKNGGFYVDADDVYQGGDCESWFHDNRLKLQPLCYDASNDSMIKTSDFVTNPRDSPNLIFYVNNNPLIAPADHPVIRMAVERSTQILITQVGDARDVQSTTGPGNLTASLVQHAIDLERAGEARDYALLADWDALSISQWPLEYRRDERNWRLWAKRNA